MVIRQKLNFGFWIAIQISSILTYHRPLNLGHVITLLAVNLDILHPGHTDLGLIGEPTPLDLRVLDDMGLLCRIGGIFSIALASPVIPCHEHVFRKNIAPWAETQQPADPPAADPSTDSCLDKIEACIMHMESMLQLLVHHFLPRDQQHP